MTLQSMPYFVPIPYNSNSGPMTEEGVKTMTGIIILLTAMSLISWTITGVRYLIYLKKKRQTAYVYWNERWGDYGLFMMWDACMALVWGFILITEAGTYISKFI